MGICRSRYLYCVSEIDEWSSAYGNVQTKLHRSLENKAVKQETKCYFN